MKMSIDNQNEAQIRPAQHHSNSSGSANSEKTQKKDEESVPGHILGIDFGKSKIGLAIADEETRMAFAFDTLPNNKYFFKKLDEIIRKENVKTIVMGATTHNKDIKSAEEKKDFAEMIRKETGLPVTFQEEMFTTKMAQDNIKKRGKKNITRSDDKEAARIILQEWLDQNLQNPTA